MDVNYEPSHGRSFIFIPAKVLLSVLETTVVYTSSTYRSQFPPYFSKKVHIGTFLVANTSYNCLMLFFWSDIIIYFYHISTFTIQKINKTGYQKHDIRYDSITISFTSMTSGMTSFPFLVMCHSVRFHMKEHLPI